MDTRLLLILLVVILLAALIIMHLKYKRAKEEYKNTLNINNSLMEISNEISKYKDINELYQRMLEYTIKMIKGAQYGSILIYDELNHRMQFKALCGYDPEEFSKYYLEKEQLFLYTLNKLSGPGIIVNPLSRMKQTYDPYDREILKNSPSLLYKSVLSAPLYIDGEFFGVIGLDNIEATDAFSKKDLELVKYITAHLEIVIKNTLLMDSMKQHLVTDPLTGLFNRRYYSSLLEHGSGSRSFSDSTFIIIDMDNFKEINDKYGHNKGDEALKYFSGLLKSRFRKNDLIIRFGGDEFLLILDNCDEEDAEKILGGIEKEMENNLYEDYRIQFSYGISKFMEGWDVKEAIRAADRNMYHQKEGKKENSVVSKV